LADRGPFDKRFIVQRQFTFTFTIALAQALLTIAAVYG